MKNCPKCTLDYADHFTFCEFDGSRLTKVSLPKGRAFLNTFSFSRIADATTLINWRVVGQVCAIIVLLLAAVVFISKTNNQRLQASAANLNQPSSEPVFFDTPLEARNFTEEEATPNEPNDQQRGEKPGVVVYKPETTDSRGSNSTAQDNANQPAASRKPELKRPQRTEIDSPSIRQAEAPQRKPQPEPESDPLVVPPPRAPQVRTAQPPPTRSAPPQAAVNRSTDFDQPAGNSLINLSLVRVRSYRTEFGVRYELTLNMQHQGARMIRWERLTLATHSASGINRSETIPFYQRLAASGSMNFTVSIEMRGRNDSDLQGRLICVATGEDVDGRAVKTSFQTRINSY